MKKLSTLIILGVLLFTARCAGAQTEGLRVNMMLPDGSYLIYAGTKEGIKKGMVFEVKRGGQIIGQIEIAETKEHISYAKAEKGEKEIQEMDELVPPAEKPKKEEKVKEEKPKKEEKKEVEEEKKPEEKKVEPVVEKKEEVVKEVVYSLPSQQGLTGVLFMPTSQKLPAKSGAIGIHRAFMEETDLDYSLDEGLGLSLVYAADDNIELSVYNTRIDFMPQYDILAKKSSKYTSYSLKYSFGKRYLYRGQTHRNVKYAMAIIRDDIELGDDPTTLMALFSYHNMKYASHFGIYKITGIDEQGDSIGLMMGLETPLSIRKLALTGAFDSYRKDYTYAVGTRYQYSKNGVVEYGLTRYQTYDTFMHNFATYYLF
ncbi:MAG: hypothetical protein AB1546_16755 [bacterium]